MVIRNDPSLTKEQPLPMILYPNRVINRNMNPQRNWDVQKWNQLENILHEYTYELKIPSLVMRDHWDITPRTLINRKLSMPKKKRTMSCSVEKYTKLTTLAWHL